ncbi:MAG: hypothetical protein ABIN97_13515 [Ginsengibacter sp.]
MKSAMNKTKMTVIAFMIIFSIASTQSFANNKDENPVEFKYIGTANDHSVFQLNLNNTEADEFIITLRNSFGEMLYTEKVAGKEIKRKYRLNTDEIDAGKITVEVSSKKNDSKITYAVSRKTHVVEDVIITKL